VGYVTRTRQTERTREQIKSQKESTETHENTDGEGCRRTSANNNNNETRQKRSGVSPPRALSPAVYGLARCSRLQGEDLTLALSLLRVRRGRSAPRHFVYRTVADLLILSLLFSHRCRSVIPHPLTSLPPPPFPQLFAAQGVLCKRGGDIIS
jgi:hypothetical protein